MEPVSKHFYAAKLAPMTYTEDSIRSQLCNLKTEFCALSVGRKLDVEDVYAIYPNGEMILSLTQDTIQHTGFSTDNKHTAHQSHTLGPKMLEISPSSTFIAFLLRVISSISRHASNMFWKTVVSLQLSSDKLPPTCEFVRTKNILPKATFFMNFGVKAGEQATQMQQETEKVLTKLFPNLERLLINSERQTLRGIQVPIISLDHLLLPRKDSNGADSSRTDSMVTKQENNLRSVNEEFVEDVLEWIGCMHNRVRSYLEGTEIDSSVSLVTPTALERSAMHGLVFNHNGFFVPSWILHQLERAKAVVDGGFAPYAIVTAWAHIDQPKRHLQYFRDAHYTIIVLPENWYVLLQPTQL